MRRRTEGISCPVVDWLNELYFETRGDPSVEKNRIWSARTAGVGLIALPIERVQHLSRSLEHTGERGSVIKSSAASRSRFCWGKTGTMLLAPTILVEWSLPWLKPGCRHRQRPLAKLSARRVSAWPIRAGCQIGKCSPWLVPLKRISSHAGRFGPRRRRNQAVWDQARKPSVDKAILSAGEALYVLHLPRGRPLECQAAVGGVRGRDRRVPGRGPGAAAAPLSGCPPIGPACAMAPARVAG